MKYTHRQKRVLEYIPAALTWLAIILPFALSFQYPLVVGIFVLIFDLFWVYKALIMAFHLVKGYTFLKKGIRTDWKNKLASLESSKLVLDRNNIYHAVILANYKEDLSILRPSIESVASSDYDKNKLIFILATEERDKENAIKCADILQKEFAGKFAHFLVTQHPDHILGEVKAKGANVTWAARKLSVLAEKLKINPENIIVSTADADSRFHRKYFDALTYAYITNPNRDRRSFQPIPVFANNIWEAPALARILAFGSTFWQMIESTRPSRLINFSTHAMSLATLQTIDYWDVSVVNEDSRQFWRAYFAFNGDHNVVPIFLPVYMDAVMAENFWETIKQQYKQRLRWAYGIEHSPYIFWNMVNNKKIGFNDKITKLYRFFEANFSWATASLFIAIVCWIPIIVNKEFSSTVFGFNIPVFASRLLTLAWIGLIISALLSIKLMPPRPDKFKKHKNLELLFQWILIPISAIFFGSIPAIDAQTRLMFGKYLGFHTTKKVRIN